MLIAAALLIMVALAAILVASFCGRMDRPPRPSVIGTAEDPRVEWMVAKQKAYGRWLRRKGRTLLADRAYEPVLHSGNVLPFRRRG